MGGVFHTHCARVVRVDHTLIFRTFRACENTNFSIKATSETWPSGRRRSPAKGIGGL